MKNSFHSDYSLIDSGNGEKLERFGDVTLIRPTKFAIWNRTQPDKWAKASSRYEPGKGWDKDLSWKIKCGTAELMLRLQRNGQIGFFPEHLNYAGELISTIQKRPNAKVLNLFAYTGVASILAAQSGAEVTHVEIADQVIGWAKENFQLNKITNIRIIKEDALRFLKKEASRGSKYDVIIADPPSFSRISKNESWSAEEKASEMLGYIKNILNQNGVLFFTSHAYELNDSVIANLIFDQFQAKKKTEKSQLVTLEENGVRALPSGFIVIAS